MHPYFQESYTKYIDCVKSGTDCDQSYIYRGKMEAIQHLLPSDEQRSLLFRLPVPIAVYHASPFLYRTNEHYLWFKIDFGLQEEVYSVRYIFNKNTMSWEFYHFVHIIEGREMSILPDYQHELHSILPDDHPVFDHYLQSRLTEVTEFVELPEKPFSDVLYYNNEYFFSFEGTELIFRIDDTFQNTFVCNQPTSGRALNQNLFVSDFNLKYWRNESTLLERLKKHPKVRIKTLFR